MQEFFSSPLPDEENKIENDNDNDDAKDDHVETEKLYRFHSNKLIRIFRENSKRNLHRGNR